MKHCTKFELNRALWVSCVELCTKFERNRIIHGGVIGRFSTFSRAILGGGSQLTELSQGYVDPTSQNIART